MSISFFISRNMITEMYLFLTLFILGAIPSNFKGQRKNACDVFPKDQYIEVGSDMDIVCLTSCIHGKSIFWMLNNTPVDETLSTTINSSHTVLSLRNFTHRSATLECLSADTQLVLGGTNIRTYSKPSNISCILHSTNEEEELAPNRLTCTWEHQIIPTSEVNYTVFRNLSEICKSRKTECTSDQVYLSGNNFITVRANAATWSASSDTREFSPLRILKIIPPLYVKASFDGDGVLVEWQRASSSVLCHCQVNYSKAASERTPVWVLNMTLKEGLKHGNRHIENLESCSNYTFSVRCGLDKAPWSNWSKKTTILTQLNQSHVKLRLWRNIAETEKNGVRKVHLMWTEIPSTCRGTFTYAIKLYPYKDHTIQEDYKEILCGKSTCDVDVSQDAHRINLTVFHNETLFMEDSVYVPAIGESLPRVTDILTSDMEGVIQVSWKAPSQPVSGYMIDWTHDGNQYHWKESKCTNATLSDLLDKKPYNITVTPLFEDKAGHGTRAPPFCSRKGDPGNITIHIQTNDRSAHVSWNVMSQEACSGDVVNYTIFYGTQDGPPLNVTVDGTQQAIFLEELIPDTQYRIYVEATALTGTTKSSEIRYKTKTYGPGLITNIIVCASVVIALVLSLGLCCTVQWKKFKEKPMPNPGLASSVTLWPAASCQEGMFLAFSNPSESICDRVYTEEAERTSSSPLDCYSIPSNEQTEEYIDPAINPTPDTQHEDAIEPVKTLRSSSTDDSTALISSEHSPYRSQSPVSRPGKPCKRVPVKQTAPVTTYITLNMLEQGEAR